MNDTDWWIGQGDFGKVLHGICSDADGPVDLTATNLAFALTDEKYNPMGGGPAVADPNQPTTGKGRWSYAFVAADTDTPGLFVARLRVTWANAVLTFPTGPQGPVLITVSRGIPALLVGVP